MFDFQRALNNLRFNFLLIYGTDLQILWNIRHSSAQYLLYNTDEKLFACIRYQSKDSCHLGAQYF